MLPKIPRLARPTRQRSSRRSRGSALFLAALLIEGAAGLASADAAPPARAVPPLFPGVTSVLWVGAHPDDETTLAPLLARLCLDERRACTLLVMTRGEAGHCLLAGGCKPDLASVRAAEMVRSAALLHARLVQWTLPDGGGGAPPPWDAAAGGHAALVAAVRSVIATSGADLVLTFDPRHGSTCHPDHRAAATLVGEALAAQSQPPVHLLLENRIATVAGEIRFSPAGSARDGLFAFDAIVALGATGESAWQMTAQAMAIHASQFAPATVQSVRNARTRERVVYLLPAERLTSSPGVASCP